MKKIATFTLLTLLTSYSIYAAPQSKAPENPQEILNAHYAKYKDAEYFSGAELSIYVPDKAIATYYVGNVSHDADSKPIDENTLFQIGSITKSFTAALVLQLEKDHKINLSDSLTTWLPEYSKWKQVTIDQMLNMTSGLPNYSNAPVWGAHVYNDPTYAWKDAELIDYVYPKGNFSPALKSGYFYSNTGYLLTAMIIEKITHHSFQEEITNKLIIPANLTNTFYPVPNIDSKVAERIAHSYGYNQYDNPEFVGKDVSNVNLSWAAAAGALVSNSEDIIKWTRALFIENKILDANQQKKLTTLVSLANGKPVAKASPADPQAFGLGVAQMYTKPIGQFWFYEGETLGFRALFIYAPCNGVLISSIFNSATNQENDHSKELMIKTWEMLMQKYPKLHC